MGNKEEEFIEEWVQDSQNGKQVPLDHLVSLYGYALLGLEDSTETVRFRASEPEKNYEPEPPAVSEDVYEEEINQKMEEDYEEPKRRMRVSHI
ncbi:hypothetical protein CAEBREN_12580 [Caenorhabditis brenneri]|uniref:Uncharacterized protein n=1 Tax=Caenorhabditis brenneri TaxID=135651 RepID=G0N4N9_CAEBE|nr:hypothetical protein CAEBREN_12580 [Caenorhabditis brenneri]